MAKPLQIIWLAVVLFGFGSGPGTYLHRVSRLPVWFWLPIVYVASSLVAYALFYVSFFSPGAGSVAAVVCWIGSVALFVRACCDASVRQTLRQRDAWLPALLTVLLTLSYLGWVIASDAIINYRFRFPLPPDNVLPDRLARRMVMGMYNVGVIPTPMEWDYRYSDRPPLQAAITLAAMPLQLGDPEQFYPFVATLCQMGWVAALYALGRTSALPRRYLQFVLIALASSPFFFLNSVYTWPKLLAAWLCVTALAIVMHGRRERPGLSTWGTVVAATAATLGLLSHGGVGFSAFALPLLALWWRPWRFIQPRAAIAAIVVAFLLLAPWSAFQRFYDPPGNRLLKLHFAGVFPVDGRGTLEAIVDTYRSLTWHEYLAGRWANVTQQWFGTYPMKIESLVDWVQWQQLMRHVPVIGFLIIGYLMLVWTPPRRDLPDARLDVTRQLIWYALLTMAIWIVVMIVPSSTMIHQGSYVMTWLLLYGAAVLVAMLPRIIRITALSLHILLFATCYFFTTRMAAPNPVAWRWLTILRAALLFAAFVLALRAVPETTVSFGAEGDHRIDA